ncbi:MAG TPA: RsmE family RNA methyltransferase [Bacillota bacterium]
MTRFFVPGDRMRGDRIVLTGDDAHHAVRVLRMGVGHRFTAVGPDGGECLVEIERVEPGSAAVVGRVVARRRPDREPRLAVTVAQALIKGDKFDHVVVKATELGAHGFWPFASARSVVRLDPPRARDRVGRWQRVAEAAARQSGRVRVPRVEPVLTFAQLLDRVAGWRSEHGADSVVLAWEGETGRGLYELMRARWGPPSEDVPAPGGRGEPGPCVEAPQPGVTGRRGRAAAGPVLVIIGPEGGFEPGEAHSLQEAGASPVSLGRLILRTETAAPAILAMMLYHSGDLGRAPHSPDWR